MRSLMLVIALGLAASGEWMPVVAPAFAHGATTDGSTEGLGPLIFIPVLIAFALFVIFVGRNKR